MKAVFFSIAAVLFRMGGFGLLIMGFLDSSVLFAPLGIDLLLVAMAAGADGAKLLYYAAMAAAGSVAGTLVVDLVARKGGQKGLERRANKKRIERVTKKLDKRAGWVLALTALAPPPFPYKIFVAAAAALQYPRKKLLLVTAASRFVRFVVEGLLASVYGTRILKFAESSAFEFVVVALVIISIVGSVYSLFRWLR